MYILLLWLIAKIPVDNRIGRLPGVFMANCKTEWHLNFEQAYAPGDQWMLFLTALV